MIRARITGQARLDASLRRLMAAQGAALAQAIAAGALDVQTAARERVPHRSGRLARSVSIETTPDGLAATVGTDLAVGTYLELGTRRRAARPWLQPALLALAPSLRARFARMVSTALRRAARPTTGSQP